MASKTDKQGVETELQRDHETLFDVSTKPKSGERADNEEELGRGKRTYKRTQKGQALHDEKTKKLQHRFTTTYEKWKYLAKEAKKIIEGPSSNEMLNDFMTSIDSSSNEVRRAYETLRQHTPPESEVRRRADTCNALSTRILQYASVRVTKKGHHDEFEKIPWTRTGSVLFSSVKGSESSSQCSKCTETSKKTKNTGIANITVSSRSSVKMQEAAAELAASQATLKILEERDREQDELERLESENRQKLAQQDAENSARKRALEEKRRQIERLETIKRMEAAKARLEVYEGGEDPDADISALLQEYQPLPNPSALISRADSLPHVATSQAPLMQATTREDITLNTQEGNSVSSLANAIAEAINSSRLPVPEPTVFMGDPLRYKDWKMSFETLIGRKNIPVSEKIYYLRKYVGGSVRKAIEGFFLLGTDVAYRLAWDILEERYGSSFVIAKAFREKLGSWPKIGTKECLQLREYADFLQGCQAAMTQITGLEILNDCGENQKMLTKLPDWLVARWNRKVIDVEEGTGKFPCFSQFVKFIVRKLR